MFMSLAQKTHIALVVLLCIMTVSGAYGQACTKSDVRSIFTPCNPSTGLMEGIQFYGRICDASPNVSLLPPRATPCIKLCDSGTFYSPETLNCESCPVGSFSNSGGEIINSFETFPSRFATYCSPKPCSPWGVADGGEALDSGNQSVGHRASTWYSTEDESVVSSLVAITDIINTRGGKLFFQYRVESEKGFDGLILFLNGTAVTNPDSTAGTARFWATGLHHQWRKAEVALPIGRTEIRFEYTKDANQNSDAAKYAGVDRAFLKDFTIEGVQMYAPQCTKCAAGQYADRTASMSCRTCPKNTYSTAGAPGCTPCQETEWSPVGSSKCFVKRSCANSDYVAVYQDCDPATKKRYRTWKLVSSRCMENAATIPQSGDVDCATCMDGFFWDAASKSCSGCPAGKFLNKDTGSCQSCDATTAAIPTISFADGFDRFGGTINSSFFSMECSGMCSSCDSDQSYCTKAGSGFELSPFPAKDEDFTVVGIRQSLSNGNVFTSKLSFPFTLVADGSVSMKYAYYREGFGTGAVPSALTAVVSVNGEESLLEPYYIGPDLIGLYRKKLKGPASYELQVTVSQTSAIDPENLFSIAVLSVETQGDSRGSAASCTTCTPGHYCPGGTNTFLPCGFGSAQSRPGQASCTTCDGASISKEIGSSYCTSCPWGTTAAPTHDVCTNSCNVTLAGNNYDFTDLRGVIFGPLFTPGSRTDLSTAQADLLNIYRFYVSPCSLVNEDKQEDKCSLFYGGTVENAYGCQRLNANQSYSTGDDLHYVMTNNGGLSMRITGGDMCHRENTARSTNITFVCDPSQEGVGTMQYLNEAPHCQYNFLYTSKYGCPRCTEASYSRVESECTPDNVRTVAYFKNSWASNCAGGYVPPADVNYTCERCEVGFYDLVWSDCVNGQQTRSYVLREEHKGCLSNSKMVFPESSQTRGCTKIDARIGANGFTFGVLFLLAGVSLLFYALYTLYYRHTRLQVEYQRLSTNTGEMAEMDGPEDEEDLDAHNDNIATEK